MSKLRNVIHLWGAILEIWHSSQFVNFWQKINFGSELLAIEKWFWRWSWEITTTNIWIFKNLLKICGMNENLASVKLQSTHLGIYCWKVVELKKIEPSKTWARGTDQITSAQQAKPGLFPAVRNYESKLWKKNWAWVWQSQAHHYFMSKEQTEQNAFSSVGCRICCV